MAGVTHDDIDLAMIYDSFTYTVLATLESLGYCEPGEGPDFVANQRTAPGGDFAMNTSGGGLSYTHSGMYGMFLVLEAVRQLRGETGERQLDDPQALPHQRHGRLPVLHRHSGARHRLENLKRASLTCRPRYLSAHLIGECE